MTVRQFVTVPDETLRGRSVPVDTINADIRALTVDMLETMYAAGGVGLAAVQIGVPKRVVVIDLSRGEEPKKPMVLVNPEVVSHSIRLKSFKEGCLSIPGYMAVVERPAEVTVRYTDLDGASNVVDAEGVLATCLQHEIDHLNGILFVDYLMPSDFDAFNRSIAAAP
ncbi:peptide deformylase [Rhizobium sp. 2MFCol3.1]|uniref:peptide deformylase n=1 Tax=Rhizobium sp. 2MFCol3.1 TaxID=1246459 RepID=UPI0003709A68|nr:peptide deformylase [Rhizobium sp. 2MFCol3.1]